MNVFEQVFNVLGDLFGFVTVIGVGNLSKEKRSKKIQDFLHKVLLLVMNTK